MTRKIVDELVTLGEVESYATQSVSWVGAPLKTSQGIIGVMAAQDYHNPNCYSEGDRDMLASIAGQVALVIERIQAEKELRLSEEKYRNLSQVLEQRVQERTAEIENARSRLELATKAAGLGVWERDIVTNREIWDGQMASLHAIKSQTGKVAEMERNRNIHPEDRPDFTRRVEKAINEGRDLSLEYRVIWPDGSIHYLHNHAVTLRGADDRPVQMIGVEHDITERKNSEIVLRKANIEMERALRVKDEFLANMSHELRTPLNAILGISESLEEQVAGPLNEKQLKYIRTVTESGHHLLALINDILDLSKIEAGQMKLDLEDNPLEPIIQSSLRMIKEIAQKKKLVVSYEPGSFVKILHVDDRRLKQAVVNLLSNAVKFTPVEGKIGVEVTGDPEKQQATISVWDTGVGISIKDQQRLFQPFVQLDSGLNREHAGTGLGLTLVAQMVRLHGGRVEVKEQTREGQPFFDRSSLAAGSGQ